MRAFLFRRLTTERQRGRDLFDAVTAIAREPHWYVEGQLPDTLDGRFAILATILAMVLARLERDGAPGNTVSVAVTERFIEVMESEHRELGLGDPTLGKTVRKLVGMLGRRTELWRQVLSGAKDWTAGARESLYRGTVTADALNHSVGALRKLGAELSELTLADIQQGKIR